MKSNTGDSIFGSDGVSSDSPVKSNTGDSIFGSGGVSSDSPVKSNTGDSIFGSDGVSSDSPVKSNTGDSIFGSCCFCTELSDFSPVLCSGSYEGFLDGSTKLSFDCLPVFSHMLSSESLCPSQT